MCPRFARAADIQVCNPIKPHLGRIPHPVSSLQLGEIVRERLPHAQLLYTSGYAEGVLAHEGKLDASVHLLQKPYHPDALSARIRHLLRRGQRHRHAAGSGQQSHLGLT